MIQAIATAPIATEASTDRSEKVSVRIEGPARPTCKVAYVMSRFPKLTETFVLFEMMAVEQQGVRVEVFPLLNGFSSGKEVAGAGLWAKLHDHFRAPAAPGVMHSEAATYVKRARYTPFISLAILVANMLMLARRPIRYATTLAAVFRANWGNTNFLWGGVSIFPKCVYFARCMQREDIRHIHAHFANHPAAAAFIIHRFTGIPYSFTAHGSDLHRHKHMLNQKVAHAKFVVAISSYNRDSILQHCGHHFSDKVHTIHCGVDVDKFRPAHREDTGEPIELICVGTLHEVKGQSYLLKAIALLRQQNVRCHVHFVGDGTDLEMLQQLTRDENLQHDVTFHGTKTRDELLALLQSVDLMVTPSVPTSDGRREGIPVVLMEGMACGLPVVASRISGIPELVNSPDVGQLCPPKEVDAIAAAIRSYAEDPQRRKRVGAMARQRVADEFCLTKNAQQLVSLFGNESAGRREMKESRS